MDDKLDKLLKHALTPADEPDFWLNQNILNQKILNEAKEREEMDKKTIKTMRRMPAAAIAAAIVLGCGSVTAFAAWKYLTPQNIAEEFGEKKIADAFLNGDAVPVNETQSYGGYDITLLGLISGRDLSEYPVFGDNGEKLDMNKTYSVVAIKNSDGTPLPETSDMAYADISFFVSPLIKGFEPRLYNAARMHGGYQEFEENGVLYRIAECDNVEMFADHGLYLCVCDGTFYNNEAYVFDEATGEISRNEAYDGLNALFDLPVDAAKADPAAAKAYLRSLEEEDDADNAVEPEEAYEMQKWMEKLTAENIDTYAERIEDSVQICRPDADGYISYSYTNEERSEYKGTRSVADTFTEDRKFVVGGSAITGEKPEDMEFETFELNDDGTVTYAVYVLKKS